MTKLMSRAETAEYLHISTRTLDRLCAEGYIARVTIGGRILFKQQDVDRFIKTCTCQ